MVTTAVLACSAATSSTLKTARGLIDDKTVFSPIMKGGDAILFIREASGHRS